MSGKATIIGAGPAGLSLAHFLAQRGVRSTVISADHGPGGSARAVEFKERQVDLGPHAFYSSYGPHAFELLHAFFRPDELHTFLPQRAIRTSSFVAGSPWRATDLMQFALLKRVVPMVLRGHDPKDLVFEPWCLKQFGRPASELDPSLPRMLASGRRTGKAGHLVHPRSGAMGELWTRLGDRLKENGTSFRWNAPVTGLRIEQQKVVACTTNEGELKLDGPLYSSAPLTMNAAWVGLPVTDQLPCRSTILVLMEVDRYLTKLHHFTDVSPTTPIARINFCDNWRDPVPVRGSLIVCVELWCSPGDVVHGSNPDELKALVQDYLRNSGLVKTMSDPECMMVGPLLTTPVPMPGHAFTVERMRTSLQSINGFHLLGRHANHRWDGVDDAVEEAYQLAIKHGKD